jgi:hypothetical protein
MRIKLAAVVFACMVAGSALCHAAGPSHIVVLRSEQSSLPESILRETFATIERCRHTLIQRRDENGLWKLADNTSTVFPVLALIGDDSDFYNSIVEESCSASSLLIDDIISKPWDEIYYGEAAYMALVYSLTQNCQNKNRQLVDRLTKTRLENRADPKVRLIGLLATELNSISIPGRWASLANDIFKDSEPTATRVAISAICRFMNSLEISGSMQPGKDVLAHARWLSKHLDLGFGKKTPIPDPVSPESAFFTAVLVSQLPRQMLIEDATLMPYNWRNHLANRLIAQQLNDPESGLNYWDTSDTPSPYSDRALYDTTYAIMALMLMTQ